MAKSEELAPAQFQRGGTKRASLLVELIWWARGYNERVTILHSEPAHPTHG